MLAATAAALGWLALTLQLLLTVQLTGAQGGSVLAGVWIYLDYFTIFTNLLAAAGRARGAAAVFPDAAGIGNRDHRQHPDRGHHLQPAAA